MSARNLSHGQLAMFIPAHEISKMTLLDARRGESNEDVFARKLASAKADKWEPSKGMYESIKKSGVHNPVEIIHTDKGPMLGEGHHRVASALDVNPKMLVPVEHVDAKDKKWEYT